MYFIKTRPNLYGIETVEYYDTLGIDSHNMTSAVEPYIGQYVLEGALVAPSDYDTKIAPIIASKHNPEAGIAREFVYAEPEPEIIESEPLPANYVPITQQTVDELTEALTAINKLIAIAEDPTNYDGDTLLIKASIKDGALFAEPKRINIIDDMVKNKQDYLNMLYDRKAGIQSTLEDVKSKLVV